MEERSLNRILYVLLCLVAYLFYGELRRAWEARQSALWDDRYIDAVRSSSEAWHAGWRLEDLEARLHTQRYWAEALKIVMSSDAKPKPSELVAAIDDERRYYALRCAARPSQLVQVGPDEFRDMSDRCRAFSALSPAVAGPQALWQVVPLDGGDGTVGLKALSNGKFLRVKAPAQDANWDAPWLLETVSSLPGLAERFQLRERDDEDERRRREPREEDNTRGKLQAEQLEEEEEDLDEEEEEPGGGGSLGAFSSRFRVARPATILGDDDLTAADRRRRTLLWEDPYAEEEEGTIVEEDRLVEPDAMRASQTVSIYSELMRGYLQCGGSALAEPVRGFAGEMLADDKEYLFNLTWHPSVEKEKTLLEASRHVAHLQEADQDAAKQEAEAEAESSKSLLSSKSSSSGSGQKKKKTLKEKYQVALVVPMTSRLTDMGSVDESPFWFNLFASFVESVDWRENIHAYTFYLGFDRGDPLYDTGDAWSDMRRSFRTHAVRALQFLQYGNWTIHRVVDGGGPAGWSPGQRRRRQRRERRRRREKASYHLEREEEGSLTAGGEGDAEAAEFVADSSSPLLRLKLYHFEDTLGAPSQVVSGLARIAVKDGNDYVYQLNDDTILVSKDWTDDMIAALRESPLAPNLGVAGPLDTTNERILTHAFVHRTHVEIFDAMFPTAFKNWWSDDWISTVYGRKATFARRDVVVTHNVQSQKTGAWNRYDVDHNAHFLLHDQVQRGFVVVNNWLRQRNFRTMPLPQICGYSPMMTRIYDTLMRHGL